MGVGFAAANSPGVDNPLEFDSELAMNVGDLEIIRDLRIGRGSIVFGAGMRYAYLNQKYNATWLSSDLSDATQNIATTLTSGHNFSGVGPLLSMEVRCPVGQGGLSLLASTRGALLFGTGNQQASASSLDAYGNLVPGTALSNSQSSGGTLPVLEFEIGAEWARPLGRCQFVMQTAMVAQAWFNAGNAANCQNILSSSLTGSNVEYEDTLGMFGLRLTMGFTY